MVMRCLIIAETGTRRIGFQIFCALFALFALPGISEARSEIVLKDAVGREVRLAKPATRIVTNESLTLLSLALLDPDPVSKIAGWAAPRRFDRGIYETLRRKFPAIDKIPVVGGVMSVDTSAESILSANPDLFVVSIWQTGWEPTAELLQNAGVPVIFLDVADSNSGSPLDATNKGIELLGKAIGREARAKEVTAFINERYRFVTERLAKQSSRPNVLIDAHAGSICCATPGSGNRMTQLIEMAGGHSIGSGVAGYDGKLNIESVLQADPDVYIGTGGPHLAAQSGLVVGGGIDRAAAQASLRQVTRRNHLDQLTAISNGNGFAISHQLSISALSVLMLECFAKWTHPQLFTDLDPSKTLAQFNQRFMAVPLEGTFWIGLKEAGN
ncbi:ABC transporter substrate-binding protein [Phyllobacterium sp. SB3]|uniref:ABC transporter substrate-binding protein n=1 Tax=Phyllobacterium sp. SB3 TaxID=3156073 RepID=UPI0032AF65C8